jgi:hypothetical protein
MLLFRSEEHVHNWPHFNAESANGTMPLADWVQMFSVESMKHMLDGDYISRWQPLRAGERNEVMDRLGRHDPFWRSRG